MSIWSKYTAVGAAALVIAGFAGTANATVEDEIIRSGDGALNTLNDVSGEVVFEWNAQAGAWVPKTTGLLAAGDVVITIVRIDNVNGTATNTTGEELTGLVVTEITSLDDGTVAAGACAGSGCTVNFGAVSEATFLALTGIDVSGMGAAADTVTGLFFTDGAENLDMQNPLTAGALATDGTLVAGINFAGNDFFQGTNVNTNLDDYNTAAADSGLWGAVTGNTIGGLSVFYWGLGGSVLQDGMTVGGIGGTKHDIRITGTVMFGDNNTGFAVQDRSDFNLRIIPEPGTLGILGMGLLGLAATGRRRRS